MATKPFRKQIDRILFNPSLVQYAALDHLKELISENIDEDFDFIDPSNPFITALETSAQIASASIEKSRVLTRKQYARVAQTQEELYLNMSDIDYIDRFAQPTKAKFSIVFALEELKKRLIDDPVNGYKKIVIPRNSKFLAMDHYFSLSYPIEIREMSYGGLTIVYDVSKTNPVQNIETNRIDPFLVTHEGVDYIRFDVDVLQYQIITATESITPSSQFVITKGFTDEFFYARVWMQLPNLSWVELKTSHSELYYDPLTPTAIIKVIDKFVQMKIPQIYIHTGQVTGKIRLDIYETKGVLNVDLGAFSEDAFSAEWIALDQNEKTPYTSVLSKFQFLKVFTDSKVFGGREALEFDELKRRVIMNNTGPKMRPISPDQIETSLSDLNFTIVKNIESLTNRIYLASRKLPKPTNPKLITPASLSVQDSVFTINDIRNYSSVKDNGDRITILSNSIFKQDSGKLRLLNQSDINIVNALSDDKKASEVTTGGYYYTPFYYVLDHTEEDFDVRAYHLDDPKFIGKTFVEENASTGLMVATIFNSLTKVNNGYELIITTKSNETFKNLLDSEIQCQLSFTPQLESTKAFTLGTLINKTGENERVYKFNINTNWDLTRENGLVVNNFNMFDLNPKSLGLNLELNMDLIFCTNHQMPINWNPNDIDDNLGKFQLELPTAGITHEKYILKFGDVLDSLWKRSRNFLGERPIKRYTSNVIATYPNDVWETDPVTGSVILLDSNNNPHQNRLHKKGDPILDPQTGDPVIKHHIGDPILDELGNYELLGARNIQVQMDFFLVEGAYIFSNDENIVFYRRELRDIVVDWVINYLYKLQPELLEKTFIYFYPKTTTGLVEVMYGPGLVRSIDASQSFVVELHVDEDIYGNEEIRKQIEVKTIETISKSLDKNIIAISDIVISLREIYDKDVIDVNVSGIGGSVNHQVVTLLQETDRLSIRKRLRNRPDGTLIVEEDITFIYIRHEILQSI